MYIGGNTMQTTKMGVTELQRRFRSVFDKVSIRKQPCILTREGKSEVVMIPFELWQRVESIIDGRVRKADLYFDFGDKDDATADAFLTWRESERARELLIESARRGE
jgi:hypothetical protein